MPTGDKVYIREDGERNCDDQPNALPMQCPDAHMIARRDGITSGLIAVLTSIESWPAFEVFRNKDAKRLELVHDSSQNQVHRDHGRS